ncbi:MAG: sensor histidine kinase [Spirochaetales bacterium]|nr:sensor histidine kinase [Spirochaetales bacterium]
MLQPLGIIINELLTNIMKYAFIGKEDGVITVSATLEDRRVSFIIDDNGCGIPESVNFENSTGFGLVLVGTLAEQLNASIKMERDAGTRFILEFEI